MRGVAADFDMSAQICGDQHGAGNGAARDLHMSHGVSRVVSAVVRNVDTDAVARDDAGRGVLLRGSGSGSGSGWAQVGWRGRLGHGGAERCCFFSRRFEGERHSYAVNDGRRGRARDSAGMMLAEEEETETGVILRFFTWDEVAASSISQLLHTPGSSYRRND